MAKIKNTDIADKDAFADLRKSAESTVAVLKEMETQLKNNLVTQKNFAKGLKANNVDDINKLAKAQNEVKKSVDGLNAVEREKVKLEETLKKLNSDKIQQNEELKVLISEQRKTNKELAKDTLKLTNAYTRLTKETNKAQANFKKLAAEFGVNSKQAKAAKIEFEKLDTRLRSINNAANDGRRDVGRYGLAFQKVGSVLKGGLGFLGITAGIGAVSSVISGAFTTIKDFEQSIADLGAITGATGTDLDKFQKEVLRVSKSTGKGAVDIAKAFQIVGSAQPELLSSAAALGSVTEAAVLLSKAGNIDVPEAANSLALAMNQFGASALEAASYTDILATSQQKGTATIPQLSESLKNVGSVARASGLSFETTNAALQGLAKGGLVGAEAGTKLRTILLRLAKTGRDDLNPATQKFSDILGVLKKEVGTVTDAQKLFGEEAAAAALTLINQKQVIQELDGALNINGAALEQASQRYNTVDGKLERLKATWDRFVITLGNGSGQLSMSVGGFIDKINILVGAFTKTDKELNKTEKRIKDVAKGILSIIKIVSSLTVGWIAYQTVLKTTQAVETAAGIVKRAFTAITVTQTAATKAATAATESFNTATKASPWGLVIALIGAAVTAYQLFSDTVSEATRQQNLFNEAQERSDEIAAKRVEKRSLETNAKLKEIENDIARRKLGVTNARVLEELDKEELRRKSELLSSEEKRVSKIIKLAENKRLALVKERSKEEEEFKKIRDKAFNDDLDESKNSKGDLRNINRVAAEKKIQGIINKRLQDEATLKSVINKQTERKKELDQDILSLTVTMDEKTKESSGEVKKAIIDRANELKVLKQQLEDAQNRLIKNDVDRQVQETETKFRREIEAIKGNSKIETELRKTLAIERNRIIDKIIKDAEDKRLDEEEKKLKDLEILRKAQSEYELEQDKKNDNERQKLADKNDEEAAKIRAELREKTLSVIEALEQKYFEEQNKRADKQLSDAEKREERLQELADRGIQDASDSLARNQKDQAEAVKKKEELAQKEKNFELALAVFKSFNAELEKGATTGEALTKALVSTSVLTAAASSLPVFFEGTEDTGNGGNIDGKGGFLSVLHPNERVVPKAINEKLGGITNDELGELAENGLLSYALNSQQMGVSYSKDSKITKELEKLQNLNKGIIKAIENRPLDKGWEVDELRKLVTHSVQRGSTTIKTNIKL